MTRKIKRTICLALATCLVLCFTPLAANAASKPAKVAKPSVKVSGKQATIKWKKAKNAKKYQIKIQKKNGSKWTTNKTVKTKETSYIFAGAYSTKYRVYVRGVAKKSGSWSKAATFTTGKKGSGSTGPIQTVDCFQKNLRVGSTYYIKSPGGTSKVKVKVTDKSEKKKGEDIIFPESWGWQIEGKTSDGGEFFMEKSHNKESYTYAAKDLDKYCYSVNAGRDGHVVKVLDNDITYVWTLDGTEPKLGQKDHYGTCEKYAVYNGKPVEMQLRGYFDKTRKSGAYEKEVLDTRPSAEWIKVYKGKNLIAEIYDIRYAN